MRVCAVIVVEGNSPERIILSDSDIISALEQWCRFRKCSGSLCHQLGYWLLCNSGIIAMTFVWSVYKVKLPQSPRVCSYPRSAKVCHRRHFPAAVSEVHQEGIKQSQNAGTSTCWQQLQDELHLETAKKTPLTTQEYKLSSVFKYIFYLLCVISSDPTSVAHTVQDHLGRNYCMFF